MQLTKRLQAVAGLVSQGNRVADVGCDHAYISIYLAENEISPHIIAMDVNQGPIDRAKENVIKYNCQDRIETRKSNGLERLETGEADTILIAGMGGALMIQILTARLEVLRSVRELVLQPQSEIYKVRQMLTEQRLLILEENMVEEDGKYYVMMKAVPGSMVKEAHGGSDKEATYNLVNDVSAYQLLSEEHFQYGRLLLEKRHPVLRKFLLWDLSLCEGIMDNLKKEWTETAQLRKQEIEDRMRLIHIGLEYFTKEKLDIKKGVAADEY
jgi:tRNA (adenine22-N1)-methyltransferase